MLGLNKKTHKDLEAETVGYEEKWCEKTECDVILGMLEREQKMKRKEIVIGKKYKGLGEFSLYIQVSKGCEVRGSRIFSVIKKDTYGYEIFTGYDPGLHNLKLFTCTGRFTLTHHT